jgi:hypothetical protein
MTTKLEAVAYVRSGKMDLIGKTGKDTQSYQREYRKPWKLPIYKG